jgi:phage terminase large subunit
MPDDQILEVGRLPAFGEFLAGPQKRIMVCYGGAGSGKSYAIAQHILLIFLRHPGLHVLVTRKTGPALRITAFALVKDMLDGWGIPYELNKSELTITCQGGLILFKSVDEPEKFKSTEFNLIWVEEATELTREDFMILDLRLRRPGPILNQIFLTFNPIDAFHWAITDLVQGQRSDVLSMQSNYKTNPYLSQAYIQQLLDLEKKDKNFHRIYTLGLPGIRANIIYSNYTIEDFSDTISKTPTAYGLDFGYNDPTVLIAMWRVDQEIYLKELLYRTQLTNRDLIAWMRSNHISEDIPIHADPSRPDQIEEIHRQGWNCKPADTRLKDGIDYIKGRRLHIHAGSINLIKEIRAYKYEEDKNGQVLEVPVDFLNHACDAFRYAIYTGRPETARAHIAPRAGNFGRGSRDGPDPFGPFGGL